MNTAEEAFVSAIRASPEDDGPRLAYADWLRENGQPQRAEFIRVQVDLASLTTDDPRREVLADRQDELLAAHGDDWRSAFVHHPFPEHARFRRGFLEEALVHTPEEACAVLRSAPLRRLEVWKATGDWLTEFVRLAEFVQVRELNIALGDRLPWNVQRLFQSPHLARLESLSLSLTDRVSEVLEALGSPPSTASPHSTQNQHELPRR
jgi:uncharacterized protein (TIGR02996 family)